MLICAENGVVSRRKDRGDSGLRGRHVALFERLLPHCVLRVSWSWEEVRRERLRALRELLSVAVERSPWHRARLAGLDVSRVSEADVGSLPVMTKADLMENFDQIATDTRVSRELCEAHLSDAGGAAYLLGNYSVVASGG